MSVDETRDDPSEVADLLAQGFVEKGRSGPLDIVRWFFCLPSLLSVPDGSQFADRLGNSARAADEADAPIVSLIIHQVKLDRGQSFIVSDAVFAAVDRDPSIKIERRVTGERHNAFPEANYTVVEAITTAESPDSPVASWSGDPEDLPPRADALMRCLRFVDDVVRAYRMAVERPQARPLYPTVPAPILCYRAAGVLYDLEDGGGGKYEVLVPSRPWSGPQLVMPNHTNWLLDATPVEPMSAAIQEKFSLRLASLRSGDKQVGWLERFLEAREALHVRGEAGQAVVLGCTAIEMLINNLLISLMWEEGATVNAAADAWDDGKVLATIRRQIAPRLKGRWSTDDGALGEWYKHAYRLRHRVVHGGFAPTRPEAIQALESTHELSVVMFDRLAQQRTVYPRTTLMSIGESGLRKRNLWNGKIKIFAERDADTEGPWRPAVARFDEEVVAIRLQSLQ